MAKIENGWFFEINDLWPGQALSLEIEEILCQQKSKYQDILIFKSKTYGNVLVLDGCIQTTDRDEFTYQEMITFLPLNSHPNPKKVLVIGGGDGGVIREVLKHPSVESVVQCEIDEDVVELSKKHLPKLSCGYASPKHILHVGCGKEFMKQHQGEFDVIITDSSDPVGPAAALFQKEYYELIRSALKPDGLLCSQGECLWLDFELIKTMLEYCKEIFPVAQYGYSNVPTYPCGQIGFLLCSRNSTTRFDQPLTKFTQDQLSSLNFKFYNSDMHKAAFALPQFFEKTTEETNGCHISEKKEWFYEKLKNAPGQSFGLTKKEVLFQEKTKHQDVLVFKNDVYGHVLVLDGVIHCTEKDLSVYQETIANLSLNSHKDPKKVLIIGGSNAGIIQEVSKHHQVETIVQCEVDEILPEISKRYFPHLSAGYSSPKLQDLHIGDYLEYLKQHPHEFDVIITVPTEMFLKPDTSKLLRNALKPNGISISTVPSFWLDLDGIHKLVKHNKTLFPVVSLAYTCIPTFPNGQATFVLCSLNQATSFHSPLSELSSDHLSQLKYYNSKVHRASFALPEFVKTNLET